MNTTPIRHITLPLKILFDFINYYIQMINWSDNFFLSTITSLFPNNIFLRHLSYWPNTPSGIILLKNLKSFNLFYIFITFPSMALQAI